MKKIFKIIFTIGVFALLLGTAVACSEKEPINMPPSFSLNEVTNALRTSAVFSGSISGDLNHISAYGFQYSKSEEFSASLTREVQVGEKPTSGLVQQTISGLEGGELYYYRMFASSGASKVFSSSKFFQTERSSAPAMSALVVDSIGENFVRFLCTIEDVGDEYLIEYGVQYKASGDNNAWIPFVSDSIVAGTTNIFYVEVSGLEAATKYSFRPYAKNSADPTGEETGTREGYGTVEEHTTDNQLSAVVETVEPVEGNVGMGSVDLSGKVISAIGSNGAVSEVGFCYSQTNKTPIITDSSVKSTFTKLNEYFSASVTGLQTATTYYVRAYAKNMVNGQERIGYGAVFEITTTDIATPQVEWVADGRNEDGYDYYTNNSTATTISVKAKITNYDKGALVEKGFIWDKTKGEITLEEAKKNKTILSLDLEKGDNVLDGTITGLEFGQSYYIRAYAVYQASGLEHIGYAGWTRSISTQNFQSPHLDNVEVPEADITRKSAKLVGKMSSNGNGEITERGFCMSYVTTTYEPTLKNSDFIYKSDETFTSVITGLKTNTEYAVRSYVISKLEAKVDTTYSGWRTCFWTKDIVRPTFNNIAVNDSTKTFNSFTLSTKLVEQGDGELVEKGFCWMQGWGDLTLDTALGRQKVEGDEFVATLSGLTPSTEYSYKAYAIMNVDGVEYTYYSDQRGTWTNSIMDPNFDIESVESTITSISFAMNITDLGGGELVEKGFLWKKSPSDGSWPGFDLENGADGYQAFDDLGVNKDTLTITGLEIGTSYMIQGYLKLKVGDYEYVKYRGTWGYGTDGLDLRIYETQEVATEIALTGYISEVVEGITEYGFCWTTDENVAVSEMTNMIKASDLDADNKFTATITGLTANTKYYLGVYAKIGDKIIYDDGRWERTTRSIPTIDSNPSPGKKD